MAPLRNRRNRFQFESSFIVKRDEPTHIEMSLPSAPWRARAARPTITRIFRSRPGTSRRGHKTGLKTYESDVEFPDSASESEPDADEDPDTTRASTPGTHGRGGGSARTQTGEGTVFIDLLDSQQRKGKGRQTASRCSSVVSNASNNEATPSNTRSANRVGAASAPDNANGPDIWTRFGVQNGEPVFIKEHWRSSTKDKDCITYWWECTSRSPLRDPPDLSGHSDLAIGDLFCNRVVGAHTPRLWLWTTVGDTPTWKPISEGHIREDGRRLSITPKQRRPSWVKAGWCIKQMVKQSRDQSVPA
ncbi:hypothetical protein PYCCODRAFT_1471863 [Trametes coccinea BRFM310]|uniref:Uncharacterized protein n=1 Tax=Trametes coccinea (strain BRFM310) TaxID=1353009 RepID=A0A1Y2I8K2_TRAC3|nr:hypothetical protein PYCCODRAFT_1471863 [Trametes coccinea BRFM310]